MAVAGGQTSRAGEEELKSLVEEAGERKSLVVEAGEPRSQEEVGHCMSPGVVEEEQTSPGVEEHKSLAVVEEGQKSLAAVEGEQKSLEGEGAGPR